MKCGELQKACPQPIVPASALPYVPPSTPIPATVLTAGTVCLSGTIGWVGLVIPHLGRMLAGHNNLRLLPAAGLIGGIFLLLVDTVTRIIGPAEMPISILTGIIGAPFYAWLLYKQRNRLR